MVGEGMKRQPQSGKIELGVEVRRPSASTSLSCPFQGVVSTGRRNTLS
jgi:hypothetical protein